MARCLKEKMSKKINTKIVGVTHINDDGSDRQDIISKHCSIGDYLILRHDSKNRYDNFAIAVYHEKSTHQIGFLNRDLAYETFECLESGNDMFAVITDITGGYGIKPTLGVNILVVIPGIFDDDDDPQQEDDENNIKEDSLGSLGCLMILIVFGFIGFYSTL